MDLFEYAEECAYLLICLSIGTGVTLGLGGPLDLMGEGAGAGREYDRCAGLGGGAG